MSSGSINATGLYVYAFGRTSELAAIIDDAPNGLGDVSLEVIEGSDLAAIASPTTETKIRPQRKHLAAHQDVVGWLTERCSILPVAFGLIADDSQSIENLLKVHSDALIDQIARVDGRVEMGLTLRYAVENVFQYFVERHESLQSASQKIARGEATRDEQIEMGRLFESIISNERQEHHDRVIDELGGLLIESTRQPGRDEFDTFRVACLIPRGESENFSKEIDRIAESFDEKYLFALNGPWAPYSFVNLSLSFN